MNNFWFDFKMALRTLARSPGYTAVSMTMFALGLGLTIFMFGGIKGYVFATLPFPDAERLVYVTGADPASGRTEEEIAPGYLASWREHQDAFDSMAGYYIGTVNLSGDERPERYSGAFVTDGFFTTLGERPMFGRDFQPADTRPGAPLTIVINGDLWRHRYNEDPDIIGKVVRVNGEQAEVIGVMPFGFRYPALEDAWIAQRHDLAALAPGQGRPRSTVFARLKPGVTPARAQAELQALHTALLAEHVDEDTEPRIEIMSPVDYYISDNTVTIVMTMFACVLFVLFIACSNVANLTLARMAARRREIAIRASLGAGRRRIVGGILIEVILVSLVGAAIGLMLSEWGGTAFERAMIEAGDRTPYWADGSTDWSVVLFAAAAALVSAVAAGFVPAWRASQGDLQAGLRDGGHGSSDGRRGGLTRVLVVGQIVLCSVLLISAGLTLRSAINMNAIDDGITHHDAVTGRFGLFEANYPTAVERMQVYDQLRREIGALPGVRAVALTSALPLTGSGDTRYLREGAEPETGARRPLARYATMTPEYFDLFGIPTLQGRGFTDADDADAPRVAIVNAAFAAREWPGADAVGQRMRFTDSGPWVTVVGVVADFILGGGDFEGVRPAVFVPLAQDTSNFVSFVAATDGNPDAFAAPVRAAMLRVEPDTPIYWLRSFEEVTRVATFFPRMLASLFSIFAGIGLLLAAAGIYAVLAYAVSQRTREIGVRRALGASDKSILRMVVGQGGRQYLIGISIGLVLAAGFAQLLGNLMVGIHTLDPATFVTVTLLLGAVCLLASWVPAARALKVQPMVALRQD